jgi:hypothetical protein
MQVQDIGAGIPEARFILDTHLEHAIEQIEVIDVARPKMRLHS